MQVYRAIENSRNHYQLDISFLLGNCINRPKLNLHLEIIRMLQQKERPRMLPKALIKVAANNIIVGEKVINDKLYLIRIKERLEMEQ